MTAFEKELIEYLAYKSDICGDDEVLIETLCRMLYKHGLIERDGEYWILAPKEEQTDCQWK